MNESAILEILKSIDNHIGMIAGMALAAFMLGAGIFAFLVINNSK